MKKITVVAPSNVAFIKYWGRKDEVLRLPANGSISMNLSSLLTTTTVEFSNKYKKDLIIFNGQIEKNKDNRVVEHLDRIRKIAGVKTFAKVVTENNFPTSTGLSSSASGFAALTLAGVKALDLKLSEKERSILARTGSGSACRSIPDGFVEWLDGDINETSYAVSIFDENYWDIADIVAVVSVNKKDLATSEGHKLANTSPFFKTRLSLINNKIKALKEAIKNKNFTQFGEIIEAEALEFHAILLTSNPSLIYWYPETLNVIKSVKKWREKGLEVYFTINTGQDVHIICQKKDVKKVNQLLKGIKEVKKTIINFPSKGAQVIAEHLF